MKEQPKTDIVCARPDSNNAKGPYKSPFTLTSERYVFCQCPECRGAGRFTAIFPVNVPLRLVNETLQRKFPLRDGKPTHPIHEQVEITLTDITQTVEKPTVEERVRNYRRGRPKLELSQPNAMMQEQEANSTKSLC